MDYATVSAYKQRIFRYRVSWWQEGYFARHVISRWKFLLAKGYIREFIFEFTINSQGFDFFLGLIRGATQILRWKKTL
jgi:hypothetical protein